MLISACASAPRPRAIAVPGTIALTDATLDPQTRAALKPFNEAARHRWQLSPAERRRVHDQTFIPLGLPAVDRVDVEERFISGPETPLRVRIYRPRGAPGLKPIMVYYHGGGMSVGSLEQYDSLVQRLSERSGVVIVSVDYRLAPENKFPKPVDDAYASVLWTYQNAKSLGGDPARFAVGGDSAGGNLTAVVTQLARDQGGPPIRFQLLLYPAVGTRGNNASMDLFAKGYLFEKDHLTAIYGEYLSHPAQIEDPRVSPIKGDLSRLPPAWVLSAEYEIMRDDIEDYAAGLRAAGVPVVLRRYGGTIHPFLSMAGAIDLGRQAIDDAADALRAGLSSPR
jgi:acetyl esterase